MSDDSRITETVPKSWANISIVWSDTGNWLGGSYALRDKESIEDFIAILGALRPHLARLPSPPPSGAKT